MLKLFAKFIKWKILLIMLTGIAFFVRIVRYKKQKYMSRRPILTLLLATLAFISSFGINGKLQASLFNRNAAPISGVILPKHERVNPEAYDLSTLSEDAVLGKYGEWTYCDYTLPENPEYNVSVESVTVDQEIAAGDVFMVDILLKNNGNTRLFSSRSGCYGMPKLNLGTANSQDRISVLGNSKNAISGWLSPVRVKMAETHVEPGETFHFAFQSTAPEKDNIYKEYFQPVVEEVAWISEPFEVDIKVGNPDETLQKNIAFVKGESIDAASLSGEKSINVDLSDQTMTMKIGEAEIWTIKVSTGAYDTPTPKGTYKVLSKQELRIGGKAPHYRMPYFMMWRADGYGIHALPYLANDGGAFWSEARDHIGIPVSHGCIRVLPEDAVVLYEFADLGTTLNVQS